MEANAGGATQPSQGEGPSSRVPRDLSSLSDEAALQLLASNRTVAEGYQRMCSARLEEYKGLVEKVYNDRLAELEEHVRAWKQKVEGVLSKAAAPGAQPVKLTKKQKKVLNEDHAITADVRSDLGRSIVVSSDWLVRPPSTSEHGRRLLLQSKNPEPVNVTNPKKEMQELRKVTQHLKMKKAKNGGYQLCLQFSGGEDPRLLVSRQDRVPNSPLTNYDSGKPIPTVRFRANYVVFQPHYLNIRTIWYIHKRLKQRRDELVALPKVKAVLSTPVVPDPCDKTNKILDDLLPADKSPVQLEIFDLSEYQLPTTRLKVTTANVFAHKAWKNVLLARGSFDGSTHRMEYRNLETYELTPRRGDEVIIHENFMSYRAVHGILSCLWKSEKSSVVDAYRALIQDQGPEQRLTAGTSLESQDNRVDSRAKTKSTKILRIAQNTSPRQESFARPNEEEPQTPSRPRIKLVSDTPETRLRESAVLGSVTRSGAPFRGVRKQKAAKTARKMARKPAPRNTRQTPTKQQERDVDCRVTRSGAVYRKSAGNEGSDEEPNDSPVAKQLGKRSRRYSSGGSQAPPAKRAKADKSKPELRLKSASSEQGLLGASDNVGSRSKSIDAQVTETEDVFATASSGGQILVEPKPTLSVRGILRPNDETRNLEGMREASAAVIREQIARNGHYSGQTSQENRGEPSTANPSESQNGGFNRGSISGSGPLARSPTQQSHPPVDESRAPLQEKACNSQDGGGTSPLALTMQRVANALQRSRASSTQPTTSKLPKAELREGHLAGPPMAYEAFMALFEEGGRIKGED